MQMRSVFYSCCDAAHGCGILKPDWLNNATYLGLVQYDGRPAYKWDQKGLQSNFYVETTGHTTVERVMMQIFQTPNDLQRFDPKTRQLSISDADEVFRLPSYCKDQKCSLFSTCRLVGWF